MVHLVYCRLTATDMLITKGQRFWINPIKSKKHLRVIHTGNWQCTLLEKQLFWASHLLLNFSVALPQLQHCRTNQMHRNRTSVYADAYFMRQWHCKQTWALIMRHFRVATGQYHLPVWTSLASSHFSIANRNRSCDLLKAPVWMSP